MQHISQTQRASLALAGIAALAAGVYLAWRAPERTRLDANRIAYLECAGWKAYYDRDWPAVFMLMVEMNHSQFSMSWVDAVAGALDTVRAAAAFAPEDNDIPAATAHLERFYQRARVSAGIKTDAATLATLEMDYWIVHRQLAIARKAAPNHQGDLTPMATSLEKLHAALFDAPPDAIRRSAEERAIAAATVDRITGDYSTDQAADWRTIETTLRAAYSAVAPATTSTKGR